MSLISTIDQPVWESWQLLRVLPDTEINSSHFGINIGCIKCGALVLCDDEIAAVRYGSIWSKCNPEFVRLEPSSLTGKMEEKKAESPILNVACEICRQVLGSYYTQPPQDNSQQITFPAAKIMYLRQSSSGLLFNKTVLLGLRNDVEKSIQALTPAKQESIGNGWMAN